MKQYQILKEHLGGCCMSTKNYTPATIDKNGHLSKAEDDTELRMGCWGTSITQSSNVLYHLTPHLGGVTRVRIQKFQGGLLIPLAP